MKKQPALVALLLVVVLVAVSLFCTPADAAKVTRVVASKSFKYQHMTMIEKLPNGELILAYQASAVGEGHPDQSIYLVRSYDGGNTWSEPPQKIASDPLGQVPYWGPCFLYVQRLRKLFLYVAISVPQNVRQGDRHFPGGYVAVMTSDDFGKTWTKPVSILPYDDIPGRRPAPPSGTAYYGNVSKMTANKPIFLAADESSWALPVWSEPHPDNKNDTGKQAAYLLVTTDGGRTHLPYGNNSRPGTWLIENWVAPLARVVEGGAAAGEVPLQQGFRTQIQFMWTAVAKAGYDPSAGSFAPATSTSMPNPDSKTSGVALYAHDWRKEAPASFALSCNPDARGRNQLGLFSGYLAANRTIVWNRTIAMLEDSATEQSDYPTTIQGRGGAGSILVSYTCLSHTAACIAIVDDSQ
jgi:hypothetical protein